MDIKARGTLKQIMDVIDPFAKRSVPCYLIDDWILFADSQAGYPENY